MSVRDAALAPCVKALMAEVELSPKSLRPYCIDKLAVGVPIIDHASLYQRYVDSASPQSLIAAQTCLMQKARMSLAERITAAYDALGLSQAEAARRCGFSAQRFGNYANGKRVPDINSLMTMAGALGTTPDHLLGINEQAGAELADILGKLLELEGLDPESARTIAEAASATQQVLKSLPGTETDPERTRLAAQAVWSVRRLPGPDKPSDQ